MIFSAPCVTLGLFMKLSRQQCQRIANYIAEAYSYPDNESDLAGAKLKVKEGFSKSLRHFEIG